MGWFSKVKKLVKGAAKVAKVAKVIHSPSVLGVAGLAAGELLERGSNKKGSSKKSDVVQKAKSQTRKIGEGEVVKAHGWNVYKDPNTGVQMKTKNKEKAAENATAPKSTTPPAQAPTVKKTYGSAIKYTPKGVKVATRQDRKIGEGETIQHREWHVYKDVDTGKQMKTRNQAEAQANAAKKKTEPTPVPAMKCGGKVHKYSHGGGVQVRGKTKRRYI